MSEREKLIEAMARANAASCGLLWADLAETARAVWRKHALAALSTIEAEAVIVPREALGEMLDGVVEVASKALADPATPDNMRAQYQARWAAAVDAAAAIRAMGER